MEQCKALLAQGQQPLVCSNEALAHVLRMIGHERVGDLVGLAANLALPSVILMMLYGQTRIFFVMARDRLLPERLGRVHPRSGVPVAVTIGTAIIVAIIAAFLPLAEIAALANAGTLCAFVAVGASMLILRRREPNRERAFRTPLAPLVGAVAILGCLYLFWNLPFGTQVRFFAWNGLGLIVYFAYARRRSVAVA